MNENSVSRSNIFLTVWDYFVMFCSILLGAAIAITSSHRVTASFCVVHNVGFRSPKFETATLSVNRKLSSKLYSKGQEIGENEWTQRRLFLRTIGLLPLQLTTAFPLGKRLISPAEARGLVRFPCKDYQFLNSYHFLRAGQSLLEEEGIWVTNPLFLTNRESSLSENGILQIEEVCKQLKEDGVNPTVVRYSLAASAIDTADIIGRELKIGRNNLVPEFNFMDPRAIGKWDMLQLDSTQKAIWTMDQKEAGNDGQGGRPPANEDSTPNETLADQVVRLQQLLSVLETQYSGETILLVFPDGTGPALLTCLIGGIPLNRVHEFEYRNGEVRLNINYDTAHNYLSSKPSDEYIRIIKEGESELEKLRRNPDSILNIREEQFLLEQKQLEEENRKKEETQRIRRELELVEKQSQEAKFNLNTSNNSNQNALVAGLTALGVGTTLFLFRSSEDDDIDQNSGNASFEIANEKLNATIAMSEVQFVSSTLPESKNISSSSDVIQQKSSWDPDKDDGAEAWIGALAEILNDGKDDNANSDTDWQ